MPAQRSYCLPSSSSSPLLMGQMMLSHLIALPSPCLTPPRYAPVTSGMSAHTPAKMHSELSADTSARRRSGSKADIANLVALASQDFTKKMSVAMSHQPASRAQPCLAVLLPIFAAVTVPMPSVRLAWTGTTSQMVRAPVRPAFSSPAVAPAVYAVRAEWHHKHTALNATVVTTSITITHKQP